MTVIGSGYWTLIWTLENAKVNRVTEIWRVATRGATPACRVGWSNARSPDFCYGVSRRF